MFVFKVETSICKLNVIILGATSGFKNTLVFTDVQVPACKIIIALDTGHNPTRYF